jgi:GNAT superfamily N-acetyltransferase
MQARALVPADLKRYLDLRIKASIEEPASMTFDVEHELSQAKGGRLTHLLHEGQPRVHWGVEHHHALVGVLAASRRFNVILRSHIWLWGIHVLPRYRGTTVSRELMEAAIHWSEGEPWQDRLLSGVPAHSLNARRLLDRWGFQPIDDKERQQRIPGVPSGYLVVERPRARRAER